MRLDQEWKLLFAFVLTITEQEMLTELCEGMT